MRKRLSRSFYTSPTLRVCRELLGKQVVRKKGKSEIEGKIVEVEAYAGASDRASHAYGGKVTPRNRAEWMEGGHVYIYLVYGMYWQWNISTGKEGSPECVLIRALADPPEGKEAAGPGKLCRYLDIGKELYGEDLVKSGALWLEERGETPKDAEIKATGRIGIDYAGSYWARRKLRFLLKGYEHQLPKWKSAYRT